MCKQRKIIGMGKFYSLVFYELCLFARKISKDNMYHFTAMYMLAALLTLNIMTLYAYCRCLFSHSSAIFPSKYLTIAVYLLIAGGNYILFVKNDKYLLLFERFERKKLDQRKAMIIVALYVLVTLLIAIALIWVDCA